MAMAAIPRSTHWLVLVACACACAASAPETAELNAVIAGHHHRNQQLLEVLTSHGIDLDAARSVDLIFHAPSEACATRIEAELTGHGFNVSSEPPAPGYPQWETLAKGRVSPNGVSDPALTDRLVRTASSCGGEYGGWGTELEQDAAG